MRMHKFSRSWNRELETRRLVSSAIAQHRKAGELSHTSSVGLEARIVPLDEQGLTGSGLTGKSYPVELKDFDERGITFHHPQPLHDRRALLVLEGLNLGRIAAEVDLSWCRFSRSGHYTSGGRFVQRAGKTA